MGDSGGIRSAAGPHAFCGCKAHKALDRRSAGLAPRRRAQYIRARDAQAYFVVFCVVLRFCPVPRHVNQSAHASPHVKRTQEYAGQTESRGGKDTTHTQWGLVYCNQPGRPTCTLENTKRLTRHCCPGQGSSTADLNHYECAFYAL